MEVFRNLKEAFKQFINNIPFYGMAIVCLDNPTIQSILSEIEDKRIITYGLVHKLTIKLKILKIIMEKLFLL